MFLDLLSFLGTTKKTKMVPTRRLQKSPVVLDLVLQSDTSMLHHVAFIERKLGCP